MSTSTSIFQILKAIDVAFEEENFDYDSTFDLSKLNISKHRLELLLENLIQDGYIKGIRVHRSIYGEALIETFQKPSLTTSGLLYLEENSTMKKAYETLKEIRGWIPTFSSQ